jgi:hypothetical protein
VYKANLSGKSQINLVQFIIDSKEFRVHSYSGMGHLAVHSVESKKKLEKNYCSRLNKEKCHHASSKGLQ